jgi:hypothetical protein
VVEDLAQGLMPALLAAADADQLVSTGWHLAQRDVQVDEQVRREVFGDDRQLSRVDAQVTAQHRYQCCIVVLTGPLMVVHDLVQEGLERGDKCGGLLVHEITPVAARVSPLPCCRPVSRR